MAKFVGLEPIDGPSARRIARPGPQVAESIGEDEASRVFPVEDARLAPDGLFGAELQPAAVQRGDAREPVGSGVILCGAVGMVVAEIDASDALVPSLSGLGGGIHADPANGFGRAVRRDRADFRRSATVAGIVAVSAGITEKPGEGFLVAVEPHSSGRTVPERSSASEPTAGHRRDGGPRLMRVHLDERNGGSFGDVEQFRVKCKTPLRIAGARTI